MKYFYWVSATIFLLVLIFFVFVPAFAGRLVIDPLISFGKFGIRLYGLTIAGAILTGYFTARGFSWRFGISQHEVDDLAFLITIVGFLGARIYYVVFDWGLYASSPAEVYKVWH